MANTPTKPQAPVFDRGPSYSDYVPNAYGFSPEELANRNAQYKRDREVYDAQRKEILANYQGQIENYNKALASYQQQLSLNAEAQKAGFSSYDDYLSARSAAVKEQEFVRKYGSGNQSLINPQSRLPAGSIPSRLPNQSIGFSSEGVPINPNTGMPFNTVTAFQKPGASYTLSDISKATAARAQAIAQGKFLPTPSEYTPENSPLTRAAYELSSSTSKYRTAKAYRKEDIGALGEAAYLGTAFLSGAVDFVKLDVEFPGYVKTIFENPSQIKQIPGALRQSMLQFGETVRVSPGEAIARIGGSLVYLQGPSRAITDVFSFIKAEGVKNINKILPGYAGEGSIGKTLEIIGRDGKLVKLDVVGKIPTESLASQARKAGQEVPVAISSQREALLTLLNNERIVRKPIPNEELLSKRILNQLKLFDEGRLNYNQIVKLDQEIRAAKIPGVGSPKGLLERSFFVDPSGKIRPSRLGLTRDEITNFNIKEFYESYFSGDISFNKPKPQILIFENIRVENFPPGLRDAARKLKSGKGLSEAEANQLLNFQLTRSGQFKPVGFLTRESELTLAPGEMIKKVKTVGRTIIDGKVVPIVSAQVYRPAGEVLELMRKIESGRVTLSEVRKLDELLLKQTGLNYELSSRYRNVKYIDPYKLASQVGLRLRYGYSPRQNIGYYPGSRPYIPNASPTVRLSSVSSPSKTLSRSSGSSPGLSRDPSTGRYVSSTSKPGSSPPVSPKRYGGSGSPGSPGGTSRGPPPYTPRYPRPQDDDEPLKYTTKKTNLRKKQVGYLVYVKQEGRMVKMPGLPLTKTDAKDRLAYIVNNRIVRTAELRPVQTKVLGGINERERGAYGVNAKNLREYKIRNGKRISTPNKFIEKTRAAISTRGEKRDLAAARGRGYQRPKNSVGTNKVSFTTKDGKKVSFSSRR